MNDEQKPLELILARNLLSSISTPGFLVDEHNELVFYNDAAAALLGKRFEEVGRLPVEEWSTMFGPFDTEGDRIPVEKLPLVIALRHNRPSHARLHVQSLKGERHASSKCSTRPLALCASQDPGQMGWIDRC